VVTAGARIAHFSSKLLGYQLPGGISFFAGLKVQRYLKSGLEGKNGSGNRRQGGGGWGTPLKKRPVTRIKILSGKAEVGSFLLYQKNSSMRTLLTATSNGSRVHY
jgi:hypothetical protein